MVTGLDGFKLADSGSVSMAYAACESACESR